MALFTTRSGKFRSTLSGMPLLLGLALLAQPAAAQTITGSVNLDQIRSECITITIADEGLATPYAIEPANEFGNL